MTAIGVGRARGAQRVDCSAMSRLPVTLLLLVTAVAQAQDGRVTPADREARDRSGRVAVLVLAADAADAEAADGITEVLIGDLAGTEQGPTSIVGKEEIQAQLGQSDEGSLDCVSSAPCLGRVGVQLGVDEVIAGTVRRAGPGWRFDLQRIDIRSGESVGRVFEEVQGDIGELAGAMQSALPRLYAPIVRAAELTVVPSAEPSASGATVSVDASDPQVFSGEGIHFELAAGPHEVVVELEGYLPWRRTLELRGGASLRVEPGLVPNAPNPVRLSAPPPVPQTGISRLLWAGAGVAVAGTGLSLGFGISSRRTPRAGANRADALAFADDRRRDALLANIGLGVVATGLALGLVGLLRSDFGRARPEVALTRDGAVLGLVGSLR